MLRIKQLSLLVLGLHIVTTYLLLVEKIGESQDITAYPDLSRLIHARDNSEDIVLVGLVLGYPVHQDNFLWDILG